MCGIWGLIYNKQNDIQINHFKQFDKIKHRGPDMSVFQSFTIGNYQIYLGFHRLAIIDVDHGNQPFMYDSITNKRKVFLLCNGEIYNYKELINKYSFDTKSDCHVVLDLYMHYNPQYDGKFNSKFIKELDGEFAFVILDYNYDTNDIKLVIGRDRFGIRPLYFSNLENSIGYCFSSEMKGIKKYGKVFQFEPRTLQLNEYFVNTNSWNEMNYIYYNIDTKNNKKYMFYTIDGIHKEIRDTLMKSVELRLQSERPVGALLSGGLDSSLIASIASQYLKKQGKRLKTFAIGMNDSPDLYYARIVSKWIDSEHYEIIIPPEKWLETLKDVIKQIETYDMTTIRASTGQYLLGKWISENTDIKVLLNGDGSDELCSGYMYYYNAPNSEQSHLENIRLLNEIHFYDVLRVDRGISGNGLEARVPFLDHHFVDLYLSLPMELRHPMKGERMEKQLLRDSFKDTQLLPNEVLYRKKEAFSDGVSSMKKSWFQMIEELEEVKNVEMKDYNYLTPKTKEGYYFRELFDKYYPNQSQVLSTNHFWLPKWSGDIVNPSARVLEVYKSSK
jgi:asparagine synthase (glutamine-hydrolysing)